MLTRTRTFVTNDINPFARRSSPLRAASSTTLASASQPVAAGGKPGASSMAHDVGVTSSPLSRPRPPTTIKAITVTSAAKGGAAINSVSLPKVRDDYILIKVVAVAVNPTDWKSVGGAFGKDLIGCRVGCDYAGIVESVGSKVTRSFKPGDRIAGPAHGCNLNDPESGVFAEYAVVKGELAIKIPEQISDEEAATLGIGLSTVGQGLYQELDLPLPSASSNSSTSSSQTPLLIYGGSTATGILGIQFAKLSGCRVVTTCSPRNFDYVKSLGADATFDYGEDPSTLAGKIRDYFGQSQPLRLAWDCISSADTAKLCASALASDEQGGKYRSLLKVDPAALKEANPHVSSNFTFMYTIFGEAFEKFAKFPAKEEDFEFGKKFWELSRELLAQGKIKPARIEVNRGGQGLEGVMKGMDELKEGKVSGVKLVYTL